MFLSYFIKRPKIQENFINASTLSKQINNKARININCKLKRRQETVRQHTISLDKRKKDFNGTIFWY